jgi:hypothetical protein
MDAELPVDRCQVEFHGMHGDRQVPGDLPIRHALCHQPQYLRFARRKRAPPDGLLMHTKSVECARSTIYAANEQKSDTQPSQAASRTLLLARREVRERVEFG